jgi:hypothetical protein
MASNPTGPEHGPGEHADGQHERYGPLELTRQRKDDGRALLLYQRALAGRAGESRAQRGEHAEPGGEHAEPEGEHTEPGTRARDGGP